MEKMKITGSEIKSLETGEIIFQEENGEILIDKRLEHEILIQKKLEETNSKTYQELQTIRGLIRMKEKIGDDISKTKHILEKINLSNVSKEDKEEIEKYKDFDDYYGK